jgi:hypothetical protein
MKSAFSRAEIAEVRSRLVFDFRPTSSFRHFGPGGWCLLFLGESCNVQELHFFFAAAILPSGRFSGVWLRQFRNEEARIPS